jgi:hypothetical protein
MNFTPVLDEMLISQITSTHHENTQFDHCFSPVAMGDCVIDSTKSLNGVSGVGNPLGRDARMICLTGCLLMLPPGCLLMKFSPADVTRLSSEPAYTRSN